MKTTAALITVRIVLALALAILIAGCIWAQTQEGLWEGLARIGAQPWGLITYMDLGAGVLFAMAWMSLAEPRRLLIPFWILAMLGFGNLGTLAFLLRRSLIVTTVRDLLMPSPSSRPS